MRSLRWRFPGRNELIALLGILLVSQLLPRRAPLGIYGIGLVSGSALAMQGVAMVLIYRTSRIINFAQASFGLSAAIIFGTLVQHRVLLRLVEPLCISDCVNNGLAVQLNYWIALVLSLGLALGLGWLTYFLVVRRFANAPRLVLTVATIFVGFTILGLTGILGQALIPTEAKEAGASAAGSEPASPPFDFVIRMGQANFHAADVLTVAVAVISLVVLLLYLRRSATGNVMRAAAENPDRAATLGVDVGSVTGRSWLIAAALAGTAGILGAMSQGTAGLGGGSALEVRILAVAVLARMTSLGMVAAAAVVLGILEQSIQWSFGSTLILDGSIFIAVGLLLLLQWKRMSRAEQALVGEWRAAKEVRPIPRELRSLPAVRKWLRTGIVTAAIILIGFPWLMSPSKTNFAAALLVYVMIGLSLLVLTGWAGQISLGQVAFAGIGAYAAAVSGLPFVLALLVGALAGSVAALVIGIPALRLRGLYLAVITLAFHQAVNAIGLNPQYLGRYLPTELDLPTFLGIDFNDQRVFYYFALITAFAVTLAVFGMRRSRTARALLASRDNELAAQSFGINLTRARVGAFVVSGFISGFAGAILAFHQNGVQAAAFGVDLSRTIFLHVVIGGLGTIAGPIIGIVYYALPQLLELPALISILLAGPAGLVLLLLAPGGLGQIIFDARDGWLRKVASRNRIVVPSLLADTAAHGERRVSLAPKTRPGGGQVFVPARYHLPSQWAIDGVGAYKGSPNGVDDSNGVDQKEESLRE